MTNVVEVEELVAAERVAKVAFAAGAVVYSKTAAGGALRIVRVVPHRGNLLVERVNVGMALEPGVSRSSIGDRWTLFLLQLVKVHAPGGHAGDEGQSESGGESCDLHGAFAIVSPGRTKNEGVAYL